jgi:RNA polymerase sigma-70 factor, ECF subfamily
MTDQPHIEERAEQPYLGITRQVTQGVPAAVDRAFPALFAWLGEHGIEPAGPPFIRTCEVDERGEPLELDVGVPVAAPVEAAGEVRADALPAGRYLTLLHVGPYRSETATDLGDARDALLRHADEHGIVYSRATERGAALPCAVEHLRVGPVDTPDHTRWETELAYLIVEA